MKIKKIGKLSDEKDLKKYLKQKRIPIRFCYPGEGANKWDKIRGKGGKKGNKDYTLGDREYYTLKVAFSKISTLIEPTNILHLGPGNGIEIPAIYETFDFTKHAYFGIDISKGMIENTYKYQKKIFEKMSLVPFILSDIETKGSLARICKFAKKKAYKNNLLLLIGQGVLSSNPETYKLISKSLEKNDYVLITLEGDEPTKREEILKTYDLKEVRDLLKIGLRRAGIKNGKFLPAKFNEELHQAEVYFKTDCGKKILCLTSYKPASKQQFKDTLEKRGLRSIFIEYFPETHTYASLCKGDYHI